ncbi:MAG: bifunctional [glutamate--ammonia ligase]-adenylyl-L-tyrosine phosphorylase/[glutamate--ammonia-ligase] adenylyltransferase [Granulosicoccus sp.]|nr:bifunctional [glutamate--ammonia ligase]-adenylyl-L-tyrosine phosphorylase/[glutamate--ammonia-ligase] adenylyltransferase [Granulosicoccus sp.]
MKQHCPQSLRSAVLEENVNTVLAYLDSHAHHYGSSLSDAQKTHLNQWLLPLFAISPYIKNCCLQYEHLLARLYGENLLLPEFREIKLGDLELELEAELQARIQSDLPLSDAKAIEAMQQSALRQFRHRHMVAILWRDLTGVCSLEQTLRALTLLAQCCVRVADQWTYAALTQRFGIPCDENGLEQRLIVIGMGKLGGYELNVSSDIDIVCVWPGAGSTQVSNSNQRSLDNAEFFRRSVQRLTRLLHSVTQEGFVYRVDTRLRPFGESGPLVVNFNGLEHYLLTQGRDWERYAMIKARALCGDPEQIETLKKLITPFVYRRYLDYNAIDALRDLKRKIESSVAQKGMQDNIKLGPGGIREIEFIGQSFQLVRGGRETRLRIRPIIQVLETLAELQLMPKTDTEQLIGAYRYLRRVENAIQMMRDEQRHSLPSDEQDQLRLIAVMNEADWQSFLAKISVHREHVSACFHKLLAAEADQSATRKESASAPHTVQDRSSTDHKAEHDITELWLSLTQPQITAEQQQRILKQAGFESEESLLSSIDSLSRGGFFQRLTAESQQRVERIIPMIFEAALRTADPNAALIRSLSLVRAVAGRSGYLQALCDQPPALERLVTLFASSRWLANFVVSQPMVIDELLTDDGKTSFSDSLTVKKETDDYVARLLGAELDEQMDSLRHYRQAREMRIACAQIEGTLTLMQVSDQLSWLAEALIAGVIRLIESKLHILYGRPSSVDDNYQTHGHTKRHTQLAVVAYGKLGGFELGFGSDLDLVFLHDSGGQKQQTDGAKSLDNGVFYSRLAQKFVHFMNTVTPAGVLYEIDLRLRPNGNSGVLVTSIDAFSAYQRSDAWTWEHQALMRARLVYGTAHIHRQFDSIRDSVLAQPRSVEQLREAVASMRERMRKALGNKNPRQMHLKQDAGGVADIEFVVQYLVLANAARYPELLQFTDNFRLLEMTERLELLGAEDARRLSRHYLELRDRLHHLALQEASVVVSIDAALASLRDDVIDIRTRVLME